ncbi:hypothetical protein, partial [Pseudomonas jessenii]|uniref:hypothetical protein n=1 Tax=Pseudomonas jessenii TaxID=77298 RepID=UPI0019D46488
NPAPATKHQKRLLERVAFFVRACFVAPSAETRPGPSTLPKQEIVLIPKLRLCLRPFAAIQRLFDLLQD